MAITSKRKTATDWRAYAEDRSNDIAIAVKALAAAEDEIARNRLGAFAGDAEARRKYDEARETAAEIRRQVGELEAARDQAVAEAERTAHAERVVAFDNAAAKTKPLISEFETLGGEIDSALKVIESALARRVEIRNEVAKTLPAVPGVAAAVRALADEPGRLSGAISRPLADALGAPAPWKGERSSVADRSAQKARKAGSAIATARDGLSARLRDDGAADLREAS